MKDVDICFTLSYKIGNTAGYLRPGKQCFDSVPRQLQANLVCMRFPHLIVAVSVALGIMGSAVYKASVASMTHDESSTYLNFVIRKEIKLWTCYKNPDCWSTANNHLLNTAMMRASASVFGPHEFALRLPNLALLAIYLICAVMLLKDTAGGTAISVFGISLMAGNPYVIDFFALARGYGMGLGFMMMSMFLMWKYIQGRKSGYCVLAFISATAAVFANLTYIAYVASLTIAVLAMVIMPMIRRPRKQIAGAIPLSIAGCLMFLFAFFYRPVLILTGLGEFEYGADTLWDSWKGFTRDSLYAVLWLGEPTLDIASVAGAVIAVMSVALVWIPAPLEENYAVFRFGRLLSLLCVALVVFFVVSHEFMGAFYPSGRKAIIYFPPIALLVFFAALRFTTSHRIRTQVLTWAIGVFLLAHYIRAYHAHVFREWWYDSTTKEMIHAVADKYSSGQKIHLAVEWIFHPSSAFYILTDNLPVELAPYSKDISGDRYVDYYYLHPDKAKDIEDDFEHEQTFEGRWLMRRARTAPDQPAQ
jgi:hypothetical protein